MDHFKTSSDILTIMTTVPRLGYAKMYDKMWMTLQKYHLSILSIDLFGKEWWLNMSTYSNLCDPNMEHIYMYNNIPATSVTIWGGGYEANFLRSVISLIFNHCQNKFQMLDIAFIFDRSPRSSAVMTPVKYECDSRNLTCTFQDLKFCSLRN